MLSVAFFVSIVALAFPSADITVPFSSLLPFRTRVSMPSGAVLTLASAARVRLVVAIVGALILKVISSADDTRLIVLAAVTPVDLISSALSMLEMLRRPSLSNSTKVPLYSLPTVMLAGEPRSFTKS